MLMPSVAFEGLAGERRRHKLKLRREIRYRVDLIVLGPGPRVPTGVRAQDTGCGWVRAVGRAEVLADFNANFHRDRDSVAGGGGGLGTWRS